jgi:hypothetical protein
MPFISAKEAQRVVGSGAVTVSPSEITGYGSTMTIEELTPPAAGKTPRRVVLTGSGLPKRGADWAVEQVVITTWYPGNGDEGTQQVLGPKETPSSWEGVWRRTMLGTTPVQFRDVTGQELQLVDPMTIREVFEDICRQGQRLRVTWTVSGVTLLGTYSNGRKRDEEFKILREGRLKTFSAPIDRHTDINWKMEFDWVSRGKKQEKVARPTDDQDQAYIANSMISAQQATLKTITEKFGILGKGAQSATIGDFVDLVEAPAKIVQNQLAAFTDSLNSNIQQVQEVSTLAKTLNESNPLTVTNSLIAFGRGTVKTAKAFGDSVGRVPVELMTTKPGSVSSVLTKGRVFYAISDDSDNEKRAGVALQASIRAQTMNVANRAEVAYEDSRSTKQNDILAVFVAREGDTPEMVSIRFYKVPDRAQDILRVNRLSWYTPKFAGGQILVIPALTSNQLTRGV